MIARIEVTFLMAILSATKLQRMFSSLHLRLQQNLKLKFKMIIKKIQKTQRREKRLILSLNSSRTSTQTL